MTCTGMHKNLFLELLKVKLFSKTLFTRVAPVMEKSLLNLAKVMLKM